MAVAAADFYTYARATGTPLPKSKQEEAKLAPAVDKWKKSRLVNKFTESKEDYIERNNISAGQVAGLTAIGAAALAAFNPNARRNLLNFVDKIPPNTFPKSPESLSLSGAFSLAFFQLLTAGAN